MHDDDPTPNPPSGPDAPGQDASRRADLFMRLLSENQRRIALYVLSLVPRWSEAEEVIQETNLVLWREFSKFQPGTNFPAWACTVAFHQVLAWRKRRSRQRVCFSDAFLEAVAEESASAGEQLDARWRHLAHCLEKLPEQRRELVRLRYREECTIEELADRTGRTVAAIYRALSRARRMLFDCVNRSVALEARS